MAEAEREMERMRGRKGEIESETERRRGLRAEGRRGRKAPAEKCKELET